MISELYAINFQNGKKYIGISKNAGKRFSRHLALAKRGSKLPVHCALRKYSDKAKLSVLAIGSREYILEMEVKAISVYATCDRTKGYNVTVGGDNGILGHKMSEETKKIWRESRVPHNKGIPLSEEQKQKLSLANLGRKHSPETREKMSRAHSGRVISEDHRRKLSIAQTGMKYSDEARAKMSASAKARYARGR